MPECEVMILQGIWVDTTIKETAKEEAKEVDEDTLTAEELDRRQHILHRQAYKLDLTSTLTRSSSAASGWSWVWPNAISHAKSLILLAVSFSTRGIIMDFGLRVLRVRLINHTLVQVYTKEEWDTRVRDLPAHKHAWQFKIAMALEFATFVIVFVSADLVFEPHWYDGMDDMLASDLAVPFSYDRPIPRTAQEMNDDLTNRPLVETPDDLKAQILYKKVWPGFAIYIMCEHWNDTGLPLDIIEADLFDNPSMTGRLVTGRLVATMFNFQKLSHDNMFKSHVRPAYHDRTILAPSDTRHIALGKKWFNVFAKTCLMVTARMRDLQKMYLNGVTAQYHVFEPALISVALEVPHHVGTLIFGLDLFPKTRLTPSVGTEIVSDRSKVY
ncbi:hypothetical protein AURDEDRAFT_158025 [Auricularia subglabra TFB-10046 SS5]|nr:hypothetical protein AURDEDRAFT_158025 [Auricularia subglabra TFB-10046 SS5]